MIPLKHASEKKKKIVLGKMTENKETNQNDKQSQAKYEWKIGNCRGI